MITLTRCAAAFALLSVLACSSDEDRPPPFAGAGSSGSPSAGAGGARAGAGGVSGGSGGTVAGGAAGATGAGTGGEAGGDSMIVDLTNWTSYRFFDRRPELASQPCTALGLTSELRPLPYECITEVELGACVRQLACRPADGCDPWIYWRDQSTEPVLDVGPCPP